MIVTTEHIFDECVPRVYPWDVFENIYEGQTRYCNDIDFYDTGITHLPDNMIYEGHLDLEDNTDIIELPDNMTVDGYLDIRRTKISKLPNHLKVRCWLNTEDTGICSIPDTVEVGGVTYLDN